MENNSNLQSTFKSQDTEEWLDVHWTRPIGYVWAKFFERLDVHPNTVTVMSIILGVAAGIMMYWNDPLHAVLAVVLLAWANFYDSADGQLARMTGKKTPLGRILDGAAGDVWFFFIYVTLALRLTPQLTLYENLALWIGGLLNGFVFHLKQAQLADYYRNVHLWFLKGERGSEMDSNQKAINDYNALTWRHDFIRKGFQWFYIGYTHSQERMTPNFQRLLAALRERYAGGKMPERLCADFRQGSLPLMKWTNILTFNTRAIVLYISLLTSAFTGREFTWVYFAFEIVVMNIIWWHMHREHEKLSDEVYSKLDSYE